ncbi:MAG: two-component regulator propeller domain-containing protein, partial [Ignavibacteria bacterium]|nr:two-component regulator propeller domain-containing protein [Ignavibacteria bacterium]
DSLPESAVFYLKFDHYGRLWFNTFGGKLAYYEKGKIYPYKFNERLSQFLVTKHVVFSVFQKFYIEKDGSVIFNLVSIGQYKIDTAGVITKSINDQEDAMLHIDLLPKDQNMIASPLKRSLLNIKITDGKNVNFFDVSQYQNYFKGQLNHVVVNKQEKVYFAEKRALFLFVADSMKKVVISDFPIGNIGIDKNGNVWLCTQSGGVYVYDENLNFISRYFENETITAFFQDHEGGIWLTSLYSGVFYIPDIQNLVYNLENGLPDLKVINIVSDPEGNIWFACQNNKFGKISGNKVKSYSLNQTGEVIIQKLFYDTFRKRLWIATNYNLFYFQDDKVQVFRSLDTIKGINTGIIGVKEIIQNQLSGELWLGKFRGISKIKMDNSVEELISNGMKYDDRVESLSISKNGELWIGSSRGLYNFSQGKFVGLNEQFPILNERISALLWVNYSLWIGTKGKGLFLLENNKLEQFTSEDGLVSNSIKTLNVSNHTILAGTNKGIVAVSKVTTKGSLLVSQTIT